jgi:hypothetical protein
MMTLLAKGLEWLVGAPKLLSSGALLAMLVLGHQWWLERDARLRAEGQKVCEAEHELALARAQRDQARRVAEQAVAAIEVEKQITETLRHERQTIAREFEDYKVAASSDPRCLSDGVLDLLRGSGSMGGAGRAPAGQGPR